VCALKKDFFFKKTTFEKSIILYLTFWMFMQNLSYAVTNRINFRLWKSLYNQHHFIIVYFSSSERYNSDATAN